MGRTGSLTLTLLVCRWTIQAADAEGGGVTGFIRPSTEEERGEECALATSPLMMDVLQAPDLCFPQLNSSCKKPTSPDQQDSLIYVVLSCISLVTVSLNLLVIISISHFRQLHTPTNILLLSLAVADLLVGFMLMPVEIVYTAACWFLGDTLCTLYYAVDYTITSASVANMVLISVDRHIAVCNPLRYSSTVTARRTQVCVCLCWVCSLLYRFVLLHEHMQHPGRSNACVGECVVVIENLAGVVDLVFTFVMPITVIIVLYFRVFLAALYQARAMRLHIAAAKPPGAAAARKAELKAARSLGVVVLVFLLCFCPYYFPALAGEDTAVDAASVAVQIWLTHINSCVNPVIYAFFYPWFRRSIKLILTLQILKPGSCDAKIL